MQVVDSRVQVSLGDFDAVVAFHSYALFWPREPARSVVAPAVPGQMFQMVSISTRTRPVSVLIWLRCLLM
ncbi:hypothetical protein D9M68_971240 [compost metagenome]